MLLPDDDSFGTFPAAPHTPLLTTSCDPTPSLWVDSEGDGAPQFLQQILQLRLTATNSTRYLVWNDSLCFPQTTTPGNA
ncbi:unnamed protein product [Phytophthora fragariaefolia]|uniref:Unnamed protein product n=1 Tax=Phytophthora fragariaefolia TaxID=1490495 RepID=A0A9W7D0R9_9STRA|nr:unnamed protein product [Phytophthora fragariaefolia]